MNETPLLSIVDNELYVKSPLADRLSNIIIDRQSTTLPSELSILLQVHAAVALNAVFEVDKNEALSFISDIPDLVERARMLSYYIHAAVNQRYGDDPYYYHTEMVHSAFVQYFTGPLSAEQVIVARAAAYLHDVMEDARLTYNDVVTLMGEDVADVVYLLTNLRGRDRHERASNEYYEGIRGNAIALGVKLADRYANMYNGYLEHKHGMLRKYFKEFTSFEKSLRCAPYIVEFDSFKAEAESWRQASFMRVVEE